MQRKIKISVFIAFLSMMLINPARAEKYTFEQIAILEYGGADDQIGLVNEPEMERCGPNSFAVTERGDIYILDSVNQKVKIFSASGKLLRLQDIDFVASDLAVDDNGDMFLFDATRRVVEHIDVNGERQKSIQIDELARKAFSLQAIDGEVIFYTADQRATVLSQNLQGKTVLVETLALSSKKGMKGRNGKRFKTLRNSNRIGEIYILDADSKALNTITLPIENVASITFLGQDKDGNSYFQLEISEKDVQGVVLSVYCLDNDDHLQSVIENMPNNYFVWTAKLLQVDAKGNIFQVLPTEENVQINVWKRQADGIKSGIEKGK
jgi:hypothetical protein